MSAAPDVAYGTDERLRDLAEQLNSYGWAAELLDPSCKLREISDELLTMYGEHDPAQIGLGEQRPVSRVRAREKGMSTDEGAERWLRTSSPSLLDAPCGE